MNSDNIPQGVCQLACNLRQQSGYQGQPGLSDTMFQCATRNPQFGTCVSKREHEVKRETEVGRREQGYW